MTRTYRMYVDQGISDRLMNYLRNVLPTESGFVGRFITTDFRRSSNYAYFEYDIIVLVDGNELFPVTLGDPASIEAYYTSYANAIRDIIIFKVVDHELIFDSGRPSRLMTHKYSIEQIIIRTTTHKFNLEVV